MSNLSDLSNLPLPKVRYLNEIHYAPPPGQSELTVCGKRGHGPYPAAEADFKVNCLDCMRLARLFLGIQQGIVKAAGDLHKFLYENVGGTADYPIRITVDEEKAAEMLAAKLTRLKKALEAV